MDVSLDQVIKTGTTHEGQADLTGVDGKSGGAGAYKFLFKGYSPKGTWPLSIDQEHIQVIVPFAGSKIQGVTERENNAGWQSSIVSDLVIEEAHLMIFGYLL